jgi:hypothetical protein
MGSGWRCGVTPPVEKTLATWAATGSVSAWVWTEPGFWRSAGAGEGCGQLTGRRWREGDGDLAEAGGERVHLLGEEQAALVEEADVGGEGFDLGEVVGGDKDGGAVFFGGCGDGFAAGEGARTDTGHESFDELVADEGVEAGEGLVEQDKTGLEGEDAGQGGLHEHAAGEVFELAV